MKGKKPEKTVVKSKYSKEMEKEIDELLDKVHGAVNDSYDELIVIEDSWKTRTARTTESHIYNLMNNLLSAVLRTTAAYYIINKENRKKKRKVK